MCRHDWYQTDSFVTVDVFAKNVKPEDIQVDLQDKHVGVLMWLCVRLLITCSCWRGRMRQDYHVRGALSFTNICVPTYLVP